MTDQTTETFSVAVERALAHPPEKVWRALTQPHLIEARLMTSDFEPALGHRFALRGDWGGVLDCEVLAIEVGRKLSYTWNFVHDDPAFNLRSVVTFTLVPDDAGTRLHVEQVGFRPEQTQAYAGAKAGWPAFLGKLDRLLATLD